MLKNIPTFGISSFDSNVENKNVFFLETQNDNSHLPLHLPYRSEYYGFGIVLSGHGIFTLSLENYEIQEGAIITTPPETIKRWSYRSDDFKLIAVFFTKSFFLSFNKNVHGFNEFPFYQANNIHILNLQKHQTEPLTSTLYQIKDWLVSSHTYKYEIVANLLNAAIYHYLGFYNEQINTASQAPTRGKQIVFEFKILLNKHFINERRLGFYAKKLLLTPKHLTETIKAETGKTAGEWIDEIIILEAQILLQNPVLTIAQIAHQLNFTDQSAFGKFFKNLTGSSPLQYRQTL